MENGNEAKAGEWRMGTRLRGVGLCSYHCSYILSSVCDVAGLCGFKKLTGFASGHRYSGSRRSQIVSCRWQQSVARCPGVRGAPDGPPVASDALPSRPRCLAGS